MLCVKLQSLVLPLMHYKVTLALILTSIFQVYKRIFMFLSMFRHNRTAYRMEYAEYMVEGIITALSGFCFLSKSFPIHNKT